MTRRWTFSLRNTLVFGPYMLITRMVLSRRCLQQKQTFFEHTSQQESPPAWTQGAYGPRRIKHSICYPRWGTPLPGQTGGTRSGVPPSRVPTQPGLMGGGTQGGVPPRQGTPWLDLAGVSPRLDLAGVPPLGVDRLKTLPSLVLRTRSVMNIFFTWRF